MPGIQIVGTGNNRAVDVNDFGKLKTVSVAIEPEYCNNLTFGSAFQLQSTVTPSPSADFLYIKNESDYSLILENIFISCDSREDIWIYRNPSGTPTDTTNITPVNTNFGSSKQANGTFVYGEDIGGLSGGTLFNTLPCYADTNNAFKFRNWIIMPKNSTISFNARNGNIELDISIPFFFMEGDI